MRTIRNHSVNDPSAAVRVEIGRSAQGRPCAFMTQGDQDEVQAATVFEVRDDKIARYDLCIPQILGAQRTGIYPI